MMIRDYQQRSLSDPKNSELRENLRRDRLGQRRNIVERNDEGGTHDFAAKIDFMVKMDVERAFGLLLTKCAQNGSWLLISQPLSFAASAKLLLQSLSLRTRWRTNLRIGHTT